MVPSPAASKDLPMSVKILAIATAYLVKTESGITTLLKATSTAYNIPEKKFWQAIKGMKYDTGSQHKCKQDLLTPDRFKDHGDSDSSSSSGDGQARVPNTRSQRSEMVEVYGPEVR